MARKNRKIVGKFEIPELRNASKTLLANIRFASLDEEVKTIVVTSTAPNEGKTAISTNLACAIASSGKTVLLVETDMRRRCIASLLRVHPRNGLHAVLSGKINLEDAVVRTGYPNLYFLDAEPNIPNPSDLLSTKRFESLVNVLERTFDYVIFDTPPVGVFVDAAVVGGIADGVLLAVRERSTKREDATRAIQQLMAANARILGAVMTFAHSADNDYDAYYDQKGKRSKIKRGETPLPAVDFDCANGNVDAFSGLGDRPTDYALQAKRSQKRAGAHDASGVRR